MRDDMLFRAVEALYTSRVEAERQEADAWLRQWQVSPEAWQACIDILLQQGAKDDYMRMFLAQTLRTKMLFDAHQLSPAATATLSTSFNKLFQFYRNEACTFNQLALCLCAFVMHNANNYVISPVDILLQTAQIENKQPQSASEALLVLQLLKYLAEESTNPRVLVDELTKKAHLQHMKDSCLLVIEYLNASRAFSDKSVRIMAVECFTAWLKIFEMKKSIDIGVIQSQVFPLLQDCFLLINNFEQLSDVSTTSRCISKLLEVLLIEDNSYKEKDDLDQTANNEGWAFDDFPVIQPTGPHPVFEFALNQLYTPEFQKILTYAIKVQFSEPEYIFAISSIIFTLAEASRPLMICFIHESTACQKLLEILLMLLAPHSAAHLKCDPQISVDDSEGIVELLTMTEKVVEDVIDFFCQFGYYVEHIRNHAEFAKRLDVAAQKMLLGSSATQGETFLQAKQVDIPKSIDVIKPVYAHLCGEILKQMHLPSTNLTTEQVRLFVRYRLTYDDIWLAAGEILGGVGICQAILDSLSTVNTEPSETNTHADICVPLEAHARALRVLLNSIHDPNCCKLSNLTAALNLVKYFLSQFSHPPMSAIEFQCRLTALELLNMLVPQLASQDGRITDALQWTVGQILLNYTPNDAEFDPLSDGRSSGTRITVSLHYHAASLLGKISRVWYRDIPASVTQELTTFSNQLVEINAPMEIQIRVLEGVCVLVSTTSDTPTSLQLLELLCQPSVAVTEPIAQSTVKLTSSDIEVASCHLDRLAVILRDTQFGIRRSPERIQAVFTFLQMKLWPMLYALLNKTNECTIESSRVIERALRCMKHAMRTTGPLFKEFVIPLLSAISDHSKVFLHSTFLYAVEWVAAEFGNDPDLQVPISNLFRQLAGLAEETIRSHSHMEDICEVVEDYFGMLCRVISRCEAIVVKCPDVIERGLVIAITTCICIENREASLVLFKFLEGIAVDACNNETPELMQVLRPLVNQYMPDLVRRCFQVISNAPIKRLGSSIEDLLCLLLRLYKEEFPLWIAVGVPELPPAIVPNENVRDHLIKSLTTIHKLYPTLSDIAANCEQLALRKR